MLPARSRNLYRFKWSGGSQYMHRDRQQAEPCYVRVTGVRDARFVEFDFSIGDPTLYVELMLPFAAFEEFCASHKVITLTPEQAADVDFDRLKWRFGKPQGAPS